MRAKVSEEDYSWNAFGSNAHNFVLFIRTVRGIMTVESHFPKIQLTPFFYHVRSHTGYIYRGMLCVCFNFYNQIRQLCCKKRYEWIKIRVDMSKMTQIAAGGSKKLSWYFYHILSNNNVYVSFIALAEFLSHKM